MGAFGFKKLIPTFIPLAFEVIRHLKRDNSHNNNIRKTDKTAEKIATVEHLLVRLEKKVQLNREVYMRFARSVMIWLALNSVALILIILKVFGVF
ncbi:MAG TPA: hypothetical protein PL124_08270 [Candidatus Cloacimonadota bacterium]|nr:hypothetical protein [Candidatus Cloacimonadota bacterium]HPS39389.1 hypothetical protein [Candidatus Cloacimonadota bacterium]